MHMRIYATFVLVYYYYNLSLLHGMQFFFIFSLYRF